MTRFKGVFRWSAVACLVYLSLTALGSVDSLPLRPWQVILGTDVSLGLDRARTFTDGQLAASMPGITCAASVYGDIAPLDGDYRCELVFPLDDPVAVDIRSGRAGAELRSGFLPEYDVDFDNTVASFALSDDQRHLVLVFTGDLDFPADGLVFALHREQPRPMPSRPIEWTIDSRALELAGVDGELDLVEWRAGHARFRTETNRDIDLVLRQTGDTAPGAFTGMGSNQTSGPPLLELLVNGFPFVLLAAISPFVLFLCLVRRKHGYLYRRVRPFAVAYLGGAVAISTVAYDHTDLIDGWVWLLGAPVLIAVLRGSAGLRPMSRVGAICQVVLAAGMLVTGVLAATLVEGVDTFDLVSWLFVGGVVAGLATAVAGGRAWWSAAVVIGVASAAAPLLPALVDWGLGLDDRREWQDLGSIVVQLLLGIPLALLTRAVFRELGARRTWSRLAQLVAAVSLVSVPVLIEVPQAQAFNLWTFTMNVNTVHVWATAGGFLLLALLAAGMRDEVARGMPGTQWSALLVLSTAGAVVVSSVETKDYGWHMIAAQSALPLLFAFLLRHQAGARLDALVSVSPEVHSRLVRAEVKRRHLTRGLTALLRAAPSKLGEDADVPALVKSVSVLEAVEGNKRWSRPDYITLPVAALASSGGAKATDNLRAGAFHGLLLSLPIATFELVVAARAGHPLQLTGYDTIDLLSVLRVLFKGVLYGALMGYYYPLIRGGGPIAKFLGCLTVVTTVEMIAFARKFDDSDTALQTGLIRLGILVAFFLALGLLWERRLTVLAGVPWLRLRDFRSARALAAPVTAVLVAGATVLITTLTTAAITPIVQSPPATIEPAAPAK